MRWSCPHCGTQLGISDSKLGAGWSFSRCYQCGGFALVRKTEANLVKVDRAPQGEPVLLPEATEEPLLSSVAQEKLAKYTQPRQQTHQQTQARPQAPAPIPEIFALPDPLPEPKSKFKSRTSYFWKRTLTVAMAGAALTAVVSGVYLYLQGQEIMRHSNEDLRKHRQTSLLEAPSVDGSEVIAARPLAPIVDQINHQSMAPLRKSKGPDLGLAATLVVKPKNEKADLHSGPGSLYPLSGFADITKRYVVADWNDRWFKIVLPGKNGEMAWVRTDHVQITPAQAGEKLGSFSE